MICVPYIINDNYYVARLTGEQASVPYYILETDSTDMIELFEFEKSFSAFDPLNGMGINGEDDYQFCICEEKCVVTNNPGTNTAKITIAIESKQNKKLGSKSDNKDHESSLKHSDFNKLGLFVRHNKVKFDLRNINHGTDSVSTVIIHILDIAKELNYQFGINIANNNHICDIVIDFGSEASQIWTYCRMNDNPWHSGNQMPLFSNIKDSDTSLASVTDNAIYQFDDSDRDLFRSLFFIKKTIGSDFVNKDFKFINKKDDLLNILKEMLALPNLKLMEHENVPVPSFSFNGASISIFQKTKEIREEILKFFIGHALKNVNQMAGNEKMACKLTFLVPNTYTQGVLSDVYNDLVNDINQLVEKDKRENRAEFGNIVHGIEVTTFSESDASFFGWYTPGIFEENGPERILIVDIGKGTTDFSVLDVKNGNGAIEVERLARSGFVGAGNVMTFAILVTAFRSLAEKRGGCREAEITDAIKEIAYHSDYAKKEMLNGYLEQLKRNESIDGKKTLHDFIMSYPGTIKNLGDIKIDKLNDILEEACKKDCFVVDDDPVVNRYAELLADQLIDELKYVYDENIPLNHVIFSGRGSLSMPLFTAIKKKLGSINNDKVEFTQLTNGIKTGCLKGPLNKSFAIDHMNMSIVGWPQQKRRKKLKPKQSAGDNEWGQKWYSKIFNMLFGDEQPSSTTGEKEEIEEMVRKLGSMVVSSDSKVLSMIQGQKVSIDNHNNSFVLGNRRCQVDLGQNNTGEKCIFFDGEDFVVRDANDSYQFNYQQDQIDDRFITETFFPMTDGDPENINIPLIGEILKEASPSIIGEDPSSNNSSNSYNDDEDFTAN